MVVCLNFLTVIVNLKKISIVKEEISPVEPLFFKTYELYHKVKPLTSLRFGFFIRKMEIII